MYIKVPVTEALELITQCHRVASYAATQVKMLVWYNAKYITVS